MLGHLKVLTKRATIQFETDDPSRLAYAIREALFASQGFPEYKEYAELRQSYKFRVRPGCVIAEWEEDMKPVDEFAHAIVKAKIISETPYSKADDLGQLAQDVLSTATLPNVSTLDAVIGGVIKYGGQVEEIYFPDARLNLSEKERLYRWATGEEWKLIDSEEEGITLTQKSIPEAIAWHPTES